MNDIDDELDLVQEKQEEQAREERVEHRLYGDLEFCVEQCGGFEALENLTDVVNRINCYGHEYSVKELLKDYL